MIELLKWEIDQVMKLLDLHARKSPNRPFYAQTACKLAERLDELVGRYEKQLASEGGDVV